MALKFVVEAQGEKRAFAKKINISRNHLYRLFEKNANPTVRTLLPILSELGLKLSLQTKRAK